MRRNEPADGSCCARRETDYLGRACLDRVTVNVGIPVEELPYLDFIFASRAFMSTTVVAVRYQALVARVAATTTTSC